MLAVQVDGGNRIEATGADSVGILYPGERVDVIVCWKAGSTDSGLRLHVSLDQEYTNDPSL